MKKSILGVGILALLICFTGVNAHAQGKLDVFVGYSLITNNFSSDACGSSFVNCFDPINHGYTAAVGWNFNKYAALEGSFTGNHGSDTIESDVSGSTTNFLLKQKADTVTALFGPRLTLPVGMTNFSAYTHFLVGWLHTRQEVVDTPCSDCSTSDNSFKGNGFGMKVGGGLDWNHGRWGVRILEVNYLHGAVSGNLKGTGFSTGEVATATGTLKDFQMGTGLKFRFGGTQ